MVLQKNLFLWYGKKILFYGAARNFRSVVLLESYTPTAGKFKFKRMVQMESNFLAVSLDIVFIKISSLIFFPDIILFFILFLEYYFIIIIIIMLFLYIFLLEDKFINKQTEINPNLIVTQLRHRVLKE